MNFVLHTLLLTSLLLAFQACKSRSDKGGATQIPVTTLPNVQGLPLSP